MKKRIGKIVVATLILMSLLGTAALWYLASPAQATPVTDMREVPGVVGRLTDMVACEARGAYGTIYYCDNNHGDDGNNGSSWEASFKTLAVALAASHAKIASGGHATDRNTIYYMADQETADLTTLAQKTDIVGVGCLDAGKRPGLIGHHVIPKASTANYMGCRFFNIHFEDDDASGILWDIDDQAGIEFHDCEFAFKATDTIGIRIDESHQFVLDNCWFSSVGVGSSMGFTTAAIQVVNGTKSSWGSRIQNCTISAAGIGIDFDETASYGTIIRDNDIYATGLAIDCEDDTILVLGNRMITKVDCDTFGDGTGWDFNRNLAAGNLIMGSGSGRLINEVPDIEAGS